MSKIARLIAANPKHPTEYASIIPRMHFSEVNADTTINIDKSIKYRINVCLGAEVWVSDEVARHSSALNYATQNVRRAVIEEIFGEFRLLLTRINIAIYDNDTELARNLLVELEHQMFKDGIV